MVLDQERVLAMSDLAYDAGVREGMRRGGAMMLVPQAAFQQRAPQLEAEARHAVAMALFEIWRRSGTGAGDVKGAVVVGPAPSGPRVRVESPALPDG